MKFAAIFGLLAICVLAAPKVEVKALVEALCPDCIYFTSHELLELTQTKDIMDIINLEIVPYGKAHIVSRDPPTFICQHGEQECYGNKVELCTIAQNSERALSVMNCLQKTRNFGDENIKKCALPEEIDPEAVIECAKGDEGNKLMLRAGDITPTLSYVPSVMVDGKLFTDPENVIKHICDAYTGEKPASCN